MIIAKQQEELNLLGEVEKLYFQGPWDKEHMGRFHKILQILEKSLRGYHQRDARDIVFQSEEFEGISQKILISSFSSTEKH